MPVGAPKIAVIGCGDWGKNILRTAHDLGILAAVCDPFVSKETKVFFENHYGISFKDFKDILQDPLIKGVIVSSPVDTHFHFAKESLEAKKHVLVEKPLVKTREENLFLIGLSQAQGCSLLPGHLMLYHPGFLAVKKRLDVLGSLQQIVTRRCNLGKIYPQEDVIWDLFPHDLSMILALTQQMPLSVTAFAQSYALEGIWDSATIRLEFSNGVVSQTFLNRLSPLKEQLLIASGTKGSLIFDDTSIWPQKVIYNPSFVKKTVVEKVEPEFLPLSPAQPLSLEIESFYQVITQNKKPEATAMDALSVLCVIEAAIASIAQKKTLYMKDFNH